MAKYNPIIVSIPHSGTRFLKDRLGIGEHVHTAVLTWEQLLARTEGRHIIAPLRDPRAVWHSHERRWVTKDIPIDIDRFVRGWYMMHALTLVREVEFIPVDLQLDPRITDWRPVGNDDPGTAIHPEIRLSHIYKLPFVERFYDGSINN